MVLAKRSPGADSPRLSSVHNLDVDASGRLYITDRGAHRVYRFDPSNAPQSVAELLVVAGNGTDAEGPSGVPATEAGLESVRGVAVNPGGGFFAATPKGGDIWFVDPRGIIHRFISGAGSGNVKAGDGEPLVPMHDKIAEPRAIALAPNGDLLITCNDNGFVRRVLRRADPPRFPSIEKRDEQSLRMTWPVSPGEAYIVESSGDLTGWATIEEEGVTESDALEFLKIKGEERLRFFRLRFR